MMPVSPCWHPTSAVGAPPPAAQHSAGASVATGARWGRALPWRWPTAPDARSGARSRARTTALAAPLAALLAGCGGGGDVTAPPPTAPRLVIASMVVEEPSTGAVMFSHDDHWHGFPVVAVGGERALRVYFVKQGRAPDDHDLPPRVEWFSLQDHPDHALPVVVEDPARATWTGDRLGGALRGVSAGASRMSFRVFRGATTVWEAPPLNLVVR